MSIPNTATYLTAAENGSWEVKPASYTKPGPNEIVIKNAAIALNPLDWKIQMFGKYMPFMNGYPAIGGEDVAGIVHEVGEGVNAFKTGDRVIGLANWVGFGDYAKGGFQEYTVCPTNIVAPLPSDITFAAGAVLPLGICTSAMGLYPSHRLGLPLPNPTGAKPVNKTILIWGGSSSTGGCAVQLAAASGVTVVSTASPKNHALVKSLGATAVVDYTAPTATDDIVAAVRAAGGEFAGALDSIGDDKSSPAVAAAVAALGGGKLVTNAVPAPEGLPAGVEVLAVHDTGAIHQNTEIAAGVWGNFVSKGLQAGTLKIFPEPQVVGKGLDKIATSLPLFFQGISAKKLIIEL